MPSIEIKAIAANDFEIWLPLWKDYQRFYQVEIPEPATLRTWGRFMDPREPVHAGLAVVEGMAVGLVHWLYHRSTWTPEDYCYLQDLFVAASARQGGIGRALVEYVYADAQQHGVPRVYWLTHESNHTGMKLYDRIAARSGFIQYRKQLA